MDKRSEVEAKFDAPYVTLDSIFAWLGGEHSLLSYKKVGGWDRYYKQGSYFLRHRCDGTRKTSVLTVKIRKSQESIQDRHEVDMPISSEVSSDDVTAFLEMTGWKPHFEIQKMSYIFHIKGGSHVACIALYDVWSDDDMTPGDKVPVRRFLEVEIEKDSACTQEQANILLEDWVVEIRNELGLKEPLNSSLFELYAPKEDSK